MIHIRARDLRRLDLYDERAGSGDMSVCGQPAYMRIDGSLLWLEINVAFIVVPLSCDLEVTRGVSSPRLPWLLADPNVVGVRKAASDTDKGAVPVR